MMTRTLSGDSWRPPTRTKLRMGNILLLGAALFLLPPVRAAAHPHIWMTAHAKAVVGSEGWQGFSVTWIFDEVFTATILLEYDANTDGSLAPSEVQAIEAGAFSNLANFDYFTYVRNPAGRRRPVQRVERFHAFVTPERRLAYRFFVPVSLPLSRAPQTVGIETYDATFFADISWAEDAYLEVEAPPSVTYRHELIDDREHAYWGGMIVPQEVKITLWSPS